MKKIYSIFLVFAMFSLSLSAQSFRGQRIAVPEPTFQNAPDDEKWIPIFVQGQLTTVLQNYTDKAGVKLIDRQNITQCIKEQKFSEKAFIDENTQLEVGKLVAANYIVSISILKKKDTYAVDCRINDAETGEAVGRAFRNPNCTADYLENGNLINDMGYSLLLGIGLSERDLSELKPESNNATFMAKEQKQVVSDNTNLAKGISLERDNGDTNQVIAYYDKISTDSAMSGEALWRLGWKYYSGEGVEIDYAKAAEYYMKSAQTGYAPSQNAIGLSYLEGKGVKQNYATAIYWFEKAVEQDEEWGQNNLGLCYLYGKGVEINYNKAIELLNKSIKQGNTHALVNLGNYYKDVKGDYVSAFNLYKKAADRNDEIGIGSLGICYHCGQGTTKDDKKAFEYFEKAAKLGVSNFQNWLGLCYANGYGTPINKPLAVEWYTKAAENGDSYGQYNLGNSYYMGSGVQKDYSKAFYWWSKAAEQGVADAQDWLGICYYNSYGVKQDKQKAVYWWTKSAENGNPGGQYHLGWSYYYGRGTTPDSDKGIYWLKKAAEQGGMIKK